ncbi:AAA family ATPase [Legionella bononiensis]|uniref:ATP-binding protein n=1 Tax=Legionella bononiensis TaxID=2793102 RepID=A0ABS1W9Q6_9GAMM|nr:ATP-binding protein [Legionella bononiensis]MBL7480722.1 ATP-binding protein [Legionella bononiensis]MBL7526079.1 ATP-binding protein [Legionella bononiensis]MBL7563426.1 ATP-binding protein [Legionella bononiensis]
MIQTNWYVITGAPSSGKTTLINQLASAGYAIAPEVARDYINGLLETNLTLDDIIQDNLRLQRGILAIALKRERRLQANQLIFFDRGTPDSLGYFRYYNINADQVIHSCQRIRYKKLFYCHQLPLEHDSVRVEDNSSAQKIGELIYAAYHHLGYELVELPAVPIEQRMDIILSHIQNN